MAVVHLARPDLLDLPDLQVHLVLKDLQENLDHKEERDLEDVRVMMVMMVMEIQTAR